MSAPAGALGLADHGTLTADVPRLPAGIDAASPSPRLARCRARIRYLSAADVTAAMPPVAERLELAERTMTALVADAELPPKIGVHPRPDGSFAHAMPAALRPPGPRPAPAGRGDAVGPSRDQVGRRFRRQSRRGTADDPRRRRAHATPETGVPRAILDGGPITAQRTAAVSGRRDRAVRPDGRGDRRRGRSPAHARPHRRRRPGPTATSRSSATCCRA